MKIGSPVPEKRARIEIIPLIDIMFFLLASFMLASLSMIKLQTKQVDLPEASTAKRDFKPDIVNIGVSKAGDVYIEKTQVNMADLHVFLSNKFRMNTNVPVYLSGDKDAKHGAIIRVLDLVRREGIQKISFAIAPGQPNSSADKKD